MSDNFELILPAPSATMESLTGFGYSLKTAIADLVDNSITAMAKNIWITCHWDGHDSYIAIVDDGIGMSYQELVEAMRPGGKNPLDARGESDLGRFSLGLKTASWSQCRRLTVASSVKEGGDRNFLTWDLDYVCKHNEWRAIKDANIENILLQLKVPEIGTTVIWENLTAPLYKEVVSSSYGKNEFNNAIEEVQTYLGMIFHRFLSGVAHSNKNKGPINIYVNSTLTKPWNPFEVSKKIASQVTPLEGIQYLGRSLNIKGYVLPHKDKLTETEYKEGGGPNGWLAQQGFYIYRSERLLVAGDWLGLGRPRPWAKEEQYRLARVSIEIPNSLDKEWELDVKKSKATPPPQIKNKLTDLAEKVREDAKKAFVYRGKYGSRPAGPLAVTQPAWEQTTRNGVIVYRINRNHPLVMGTRKKLGALSVDFDAALRVLEESVPVQKIWLDTAESDQNHAIPYEDLDGELISDIQQTYKFLLNSMSRQSAIDLLRVTEPFNRYQDIIETAIDKL